MGFDCQIASHSMHDWNLTGGYYISQCNILIICYRYCWYSKRVFILFLAHISHIKKVGDPVFLRAPLFLWKESIPVDSIKKKDRFFKEFIVFWVNLHFKMKVKWVSNFKVSFPPCMIKIWLVIIIYYNSAMYFWLVAIK